MPDFRKITAVVKEDGDSELNIILLDYDDPINTIKAIKDPNYISDMIGEHLRYIEDLSKFNPCDYIDDYDWVSCGGSFSMRSRAWDEAITEEEFNNPPDKWKNATLQTNNLIVYGDGTHEGI